MLYGGIDAGGTSFKCGVFDDALRHVESFRVPTTAPQETLETCADYFSRFDGQMKTLGIASFGPLNLDLDSREYGMLLDTPKPDWQRVPVLTTLERLTGLPVSIDTDVNGALLAECELGAAKGVRSAAYVTVGTGIGAGIRLSDHWVGQPSHPEFGHITVQRHADDAGFKSVCRFHDDCLEGFASAKAFEARFGQAETLSTDHPGWEIEAWYLAQACRSLYLSFRLDRIILGGGLMQADGLIDRVRREFVRQLGGYLDMPTDQANRLIVVPELGDLAGMTGAALLGRRRLRSG